MLLHSFHHRSYLRRHSVVIYNLSIAFNMYGNLCPKTSSSSLTSMPDSDSKYISLPPGVHPKKIRVIRRHKKTLLDQAALCILRGMTFQNVSEVYDVPKTTLRDFMVRQELLLRSPKTK